MQQEAAKYNNSFYEQSGVQNFNLQKN